MPTDASSNDLGNGDKNVDNAVNETVQTTDDVSANDDAVASTKTQVLEAPAVPVGAAEATADVAATTVEVSETVVATSAADGTTAG